MYSYSYGYVHALGCKYSENRDVCRMYHTSPVQTSYLYKIQLSFAELLM